MKLIRSLKEITPTNSQPFGGKAAALARLHGLGYRVPHALAISTRAYHEYLRQTGLGAKILMELGRRDFQDMRWEELWDAALRLRNLFLTTPIPSALHKILADSLDKEFSTRPLVIRSSAPGEDSANVSFAGLHDSFVNVRGRDQTLLAVRKVWASLWSDRALLYRQELGLDIETSAMGVLVQELVVGEASGVAFSRSPTNPEQVAVEAVWGLNQGLVDGSVEPDFWALDRRGETILAFRPAARRMKMTPAGDGLTARRLSEEQARATPVSDKEVLRVARSVLALERELGAPQDMEWTLAGGDLVFLQARPITTGQKGGPDDPKGWYLTLHRSLENLKCLQRKIEQEVIPGMEEEAASLAAMELALFSDEALADEINRRRGRLSHWEEVYRAECIPMAHGVRLFGEFYNDALRPGNPFEFVELLRGEGFLAMERNRKLASLADAARSDGNLLDRLQTAPDSLPEPFAEVLRELAETSGLSPRQVAKLVGEMARQPPMAKARSNEALRKAYLNNFEGPERQKAEDVLLMARASYRLRDDDNISLGKITRELARAEEEGHRRRDRGAASSLMAVLQKATSRPEKPVAAARNNPTGRLRARQLQGQPASPGLATATARVIRSRWDLEAFCAGEILVCDAIDPTMTFVVPLAAGIIERRGGMLIHGAIIAREYGIPCVTGIADATSLIASGDRLTLDGYLGIVFFPSPSGRMAPDRETGARRDGNDVSRQPAGPTLGKAEQK